MKKFILFVLVIAAVIGAFAIYLAATTPSSSAGIRFPLTPAHRALVAHVPQSAEAFALIPTAAALDSKLRANPITRGAIDDWSANHLMPRPWMIGAADLLAWREGKQTRYLLRLDPVRAVIVRIYLMFRGDSGGTLLINAPAGSGLDADEVARIVALADKLPAADALVVQRERGKGAFPPMPRPAVTALQVQPAEIVITSRAASEGDSVPSAITAPVARDALLTASFASAPRSLDDLNRLLGAKVSTFLSDGGSITLYDIDAGKLVPRPLGVIAVPATPERRAALDAFIHTLQPGELVGVRPRGAERDGQLLLSFDQSLDLYLKDAIEPVTYPAARWAIRLDPQRLVPILQRIDDSVGLRIAAPHLFRSARDLGRWIGALQEAKSIEGVDSVDGPQEQLRVRIAAK